MGKHRYKWADANDLRINVFPSGEPLDPDDQFPDPDRDNLASVRIVLSDPWGTVLVIEGTQNELSGFIQRLSDTCMASP